ncbi:hypothetical protein RFI_38449 [Reticulomyxa filosa]|uniref:Uncharacterized protein n=1 Tax=Reticulomyxa filosa TaxID=46433 RepID=X6LE69_RETFI|nr:hypothetical protein RFI_38449 [Reticulomyxa filosa]|eukprot:ETN99039.1 hypothetical protein RFI_38449 [Reticulomyxa filosa]
MKNCKKIMKKKNYEEKEEERGAKQTTAANRFVGAAKYQVKQTLWSDRLYGRQSICWSSEEEKIEKVVRKCSNMEIEQIITVRINVGAYTFLQTIIGVNNIKNNAELQSTGAKK